MLASMTGRASFLTDDDGPPSSGVAGAGVLIGCEGEGEGEGDSVAP
jgi:hypothetical protein